MNWFGGDRWELVFIKLRDGGPRSAILRTGITVEIIRIFHNFNELKIWEVDKRRFLDSKFGFVKQDGIVGYQGVFSYGEFNRLINRLWS